MEKLAEWKVPDNFHQVPSQVDGITAYAPAPVKTDKHTLHTYQCPNCGASTKFDVAAAGIACEHCRHTAIVKPDPGGLTEAHHEFTLRILSTANQGWGAERQHMLCESCGADFSITEDSITSTCPFCAANKVHISPAPVEFLRPEFIIPFKISPELQQTLINKWLRQGWFHPSNMASSAILQKFTGIYLPFWIFDAKINANWRANVNTFDEVRVEGENNTRVEIKDGKVSGQTQLEINDIPHPGTSKVSHILLKKLNPFHFEELKKYAPDYLAGWQAQHYNIPLEESWTIAKEDIREVAKSTIRGQIKGNKIRNFSMTANFPEETWRNVLLPVYLSSYKYKKRIFQMMVNGQTGAVAGQKPVIWGKVWLAIALLLAPGISLGLHVFPLLMLGQVSTVMLILEIVLLVMGGVWSLITFINALDSESA